MFVLSTILVALIAPSLAEHLRARGYTAAGMATPIFFALWTVGWAVGFAAHLLVELPLRRLSRAVWGVSVLQ
jgi:hypothetical protein